MAIDDVSSRDIMMILYMNLSKLGERVACKNIKHSFIAFSHTTHREQTLSHKIQSYSA